ncbi:putative Cell differentiation family, Rcd1-like [Blattamonas nauphoetae]|uniref:Cell differentiation family, Rcd1-like n=1 Tax=Blattamonas nauphoetae TaxID=2049346 RepID=A0ABQ9XAV6_9EUKA|nr:putative Cell differentiation family, Rcd1-like [Blattamonas nauphoetae]
MYCDTEPQEDVTTLYAVPDDPDSSVVESDQLPWDLGHSVMNHVAIDEVTGLLLKLRNPTNREEAFQRLIAIKDVMPYSDILGPQIVNSSGILSILVEEITSIYPFTTNVDQSPIVFHRALYSILLLQAVAQNTVTNLFAIQHRFPFLGFPFIRYTGKDAAILQLKEESLWLIAYSTQNIDDTAHRCLIDNEIMKVCQKVLEESIAETFLPAIISIYSMLLFDSIQQFKLFTSETSMIITLMEQINHFLKEMGEVKTETENRCIEYIVRLIETLMEHVVFHEPIKKALGSSESRYGSNIIRLYEQPDIAERFSDTRFLVMTSFQKTEQT